MRAVGAFLAVLIWSASAPADAAAAEWRVVPERSEIAFEYALNTRPGSGVFSRVTGEGSFDPAHIADTRFDLIIDVTSLDLGDPLESAFAQSADWFDAASFPTARYHLAALTPQGEGRFEALGDLTIRDRLKVLRTPITLAITEEQAEASGIIAFDRRDFGVGFGPSALFISVGTAVSVRFRLVAIRR